MVLITTLLASLTVTRVTARTAVPATGTHGIVSLGLERQIESISQHGHHFLHESLVAPRLPIAVVTTHDVSRQIRALGGTVEADIAGRVLAASLSIGKIRALSRVQGVQTIYPSTTFRADDDVSTPEIQAPQAWALQDTQSLPVRGAHVLVGIVDSGIDFHNPDFRNADGTTRIRYLWDQTTKGHPPSGFTSGYECDGTSINAGSCPEKDIDGHGTHVSGIAAGNGQSSDGREVGVAPDADIIAVKSDLSTDNILQAWQYLVQKAQALHEPIVINNSFGDMLAPHDGSEPDSQAIDRLSGQGRIFVVASGNEANKRMHTDGTLHAGQTTNVELTAPASSTDFALNFFYPTGTKVSASLTNADSQETFGPIAQGKKLDKKSANGHIEYFMQSDAYNTQWNELYVEVASDRTVHGGYVLALHGKKVGGNGRFDGWIGDDDSAYFSSPDESDTIDDPADAHQVISVGNYATRVIWTGEDGKQHNACTYYICTNNTLSVGAIKLSSSAGPTEDGRHKPDISAPGTMIVSSLSADATICSSSQQSDTCLDPAFITADGKNYIASGTSMASPHVAGVVALMLQVDPTLDAQTAITILDNTARHDAFTGPGWSPQYGNGKVDALAAVQAAMADAKVVKPTPVPPTATPVPTASFSLISVRAEKQGSKPDWLLRRAPLNHLSTGKSVYLSLYVRFSTLLNASKVAIEWTVKRGSSIAAHHTTRETLGGADTGEYREHWPFTPKTAGTYQFNGRVTVDGVSQQKVVSFTVQARHAR
jgi:subtilisin family serine protease